MSIRGTYRVGTVAAIVLLLEVLAWSFGTFVWYTLIYRETQFKLSRPEVLYALALGLSLIHI